MLIDLTFVSVITQLVVLANDYLALSSSASSFEGVDGAAHAAADEGTIL